MNLKQLFIDHCKIKGLEINANQIICIEAINRFNQNNFNHNFLLNIFSTKKK